MTGTPTPAGMPPLSESITLPGSLYEGCTYSLSSALWGWLMDAGSLAQSVAFFLETPQAAREMTRREEKWAHKRYFQIYLKKEKEFQIEF